MARKPRTPPVTTSAASRAAAAPAGAAEPPPAGRDDARVRFLVNLVHELRTPLALVDGPLQQLARQGGLDSEARDLVAVARQNCLRLMNVAEDLLDLARADHGTRPLEIRALELQPWLHDLTAAVARHPALGPLALVDQVDGAGILVAADPRALERVFLNLVSNAIKFGAGGREIRIGSAVSDAQAGFFVADDGIGIAPADQAGIFERFRQVDGSMTRRYGGIGIGLALVREIVAALNGRVELDSSAGHGARFTVWLPRCSDAQARILPAMRPTLVADSAGPDDFERVLRRPLASAAPPLRPSNAADRTLAERGGDDADHDQGAAAQRPRVVVVEDEAELRWLIEAALRPAFEVIAAADGAAGLAAVREHRPDVVLTDWMMPGIDGLTLAHHVRAMQPRPMVVLITARMDDTERAAALQRGVDDFLTKPFSLAELGARLHNLAQRGRAERALHAANAQLRSANRELTATRAALIQDEKLKSIGVLSAGLIHEINNPINFMRTAAELLRREPAVHADPSVAELVDAIEQGLARVGTIIGDLRVFAFRGGANDASQRNRAFALDRAVETALRLCGHQLRSIRVLADLLSRHPEALIRGRTDQGIQ